MLHFTFPRQNPFFAGPSGSLGSADRSSACHPGYWMFGFGKIHTGHGHAPKQSAQMFAFSCTNVTTHTHTPGSSSRRLRSVLFIWCFDRCSERIEGFFCVLYSKQCNVCASIYPQIQRQPFSIVGGLLTYFLFSVYAVLSAVCASVKV